jgi:heme-degrading monooxygenase HmoA
METMSMNAERKRFVSINVFTPKAGKLDEFLNIQVEGLPSLRKGFPASRGGRLYRAEDGSKAVLLSVFDDAEAAHQFSTSDAFLAHRAKLAPLLERAEPTRYELVYEAGEV